MDTLDALPGTVALTRAGIAIEDARRLSAKVLVGGALGAALSDEVFPVENPADLTVVGTAPRCRAPDVDRAVRAADKVFPAWSAVAARERGRMLARLADRLEAQTERLAALLCLETGNAMSTQARPEVGAMVDVFRLFAGLAGELKGTTVPWSNGVTCYTTRDPWGVVGAIIPWNAPLFLTACKLAPALVAGNTVVLKTAEQAPLAALRCVEILQEELPPGVVNVISGFGEEAGRPLVEHPRVRKITFTGSTAVGQLVLRYAAEKVAPVTLELGGKSPNVVLPDADLSLAVPGILHGMRFTRQGQSCSAGTRLLLHEAVYDEVVGRVARGLQAMRVGDPMDEAVEIGAIISKEQYERVVQYVEMARSTPGARIVCGGRRPQDPSLPPGYFYSPTLIEGVPHESPVCQDEIFGPVAVCLKWRDFDRMIELANDTRFGLAAAIWTRDLNRALAFVNRVQAGFVQVNQYITPQANLPYGGLKMSGLGKENSLETMLDHFTCSKTVMLNPGSAGA